MTVAQEKAGVDVLAMPHKDRRRVECTANRGRAYVVYFDQDGDAFEVHCVVVSRRRSHERILWQRLKYTPKAMSATVMCAIRSAWAELERVAAARAQAVQP